MATASNWSGRWPVAEPGGDRLAGRRLYLCTADRPDLARFLAACIAGGVDIVQLRDKVLDARPQLARARLAAELVRAHGPPSTPNDRPALPPDCAPHAVRAGHDGAPSRA